MIRTVKIALLFFSLGFSTWGFAQIGGTLNTMPELFQATYTNPAKAPSSSFHFGLPALSGVHVSLSNTGFSYYGLPKNGEAKTIDRFLNKLAPLNYFSTSLDFDWLSFGLRLKKGYFSFSMREKVLFRWTYPEDLFRVLVQGNGGDLLGKRTSLDGLALDFNRYREVAFGYSQKIGERLRVGTRVKLLFGYQNLKTNETEFGLTTHNEPEDNYPIELDGKVDIISSGVSSLESIFGVSNQLSPDSINNFFSFSNNRGLALDFGAEYQLTDYLKLSASVIDLGGIHYKEDIRNLKTDDISFRFTGVDVFNFIGKSDTTSKAQEVLLDSLAEAFAMEENQVEYNFALNGKIFFGGELTLFKKNSVGAFATSEFIRGKIKPSLSAFYNTYLLRWLMATVNYSFANRTATNIGAGLVANLGSIQMYAVTDNLVGISLPARARTIDVRFGFNLRFGNGLRNVHEVSNRKAEKALMMIE